MRQAVFLFPRDAVSNYFSKGDLHVSFPPRQTIPGGEGTYLSNASPLARRFIPGMTERPNRSAAIPPQTATPTPPTNAPSPAHHAPSPQRIIPGTTDRLTKTRDPQDQSIPPRGPCQASYRPTAPSPPTKNSRDDKTPPHAGHHNSNHPVGRPHLSPGA